MKTRPFLVHALSPLHAGTGQAADVIELPTARMKATGIPFLPGSSIKGVLRDERTREAKAGGDTNDQEKVLAVFGPDSSQAEDHAGALVVSDARLLALPVRSFRGTFAWTTSPLLLMLTRRDLGVKLPVPALDGRRALVSAESACLHNDRIYLEDLDLPAEGSPALSEWTRWLAPLASPEENTIFTKRFVVVDDETMTFLWETATQVDARVRLSEQTRTVARGALWLEESLPPETLLVGVMAADQSRRKGVSMTPEDVLDFALGKEAVIQLGGKATTGRGRCRVVPIAIKEAAHEGA